MMGDAAAEYLNEFRARGEAIADACTRCGDCFRACPMVEPAGIGMADPVETTAAIVDLIIGGPGNDDAVRWASVCSGSGNCIPACTHGVNPRFMVQLARGFARAQKAGAPLATRWRAPFQTMSRGVRILSRLQMPPETLARLRGQGQPPRHSAPEIVFYTGCNIIKTPHIALLCLDVLDMLGVDYDVMGGPANAAASISFARAISPAPPKSGSRRSTASPRPAPRPCCHGARAASCRSARSRCPATSGNSATSRSI
jgi:heterodisulfide reductase subunit D